MASEAQIYYEHTLTNYQHPNGSNEYVFTYPDHWIQYPSQNHMVSLRSVRITPAARDFYIHGIKVKREGIEGFNTDFSMRIYLGSDEDMGKLNEKLEEHVSSIYRDYKDELAEARLSTPAEPCRLSRRDCAIYYVQTDNSLVFKILSTAVDNPFYWFFENSDSYTSTDFNQMVNIKDDGLFKLLYQFQDGKIEAAELEQELLNYPNVDVWYETKNQIRMITKIVFKNVWNRSKLIIGSTLSSLSENRYLTISDISHNPPKSYDVKGFNDKFSMFLYDLSSKREIELPSDGKDLITVETILIAT